MLASGCKAGERHDLASEAAPVAAGLPAVEAAAEPVERIAILVLGMHRSGTSAVTRLLSLAGAELPRELIEPGEGNARGHWESPLIALHNEDLLSQRGASWSDWQALDWSDLAQADLAAVSEGIAAVVGEQFGKADVIVLKDPRICRMVPLYEAALSREGYRIVAVLPYRNPAEVIDSLMARSSWPAHARRVDAALLWLTHVLEAEYDSRGMPRVFVNFAEILSDWQPLVRDLEAAGDFRFTVPRSELAQAVCGFLDQGERHQRHTTMALTEEPVTNGWVSEAYELLEGFRANSASPRGIARFDEIRAALQGAMPMLRSMAEMAHEAGAALHKDRELHRQKIAVLDHEIAALDHDSAALRNDVSDLKMRLEEQAEAYEVKMEALQEAYTGSRSWRITAPLRAASTTAGLLRWHASSARTLAKKGGGWRASARTGLAVLKHEGVSGLRRRLEVVQPDLRILHTEDSDADYVNYFAAARGDVLLSEWHTGLLRAVHNNSPAASDGPTLGLSLVTYNSADWLPGFFSSLLGQSFSLSRLNVAVVDHGSTDGTRAALETHLLSHGDRYASFEIHDRPNLGFGAGHDYAIRQLTDPFVLVSNVDLEFHSDSIAAAMRAALADRDDVASWELRQCPYEHPKYFDPVTLEAAWSSHACVLIRREAYQQVGGYEERIFMYGEDVELSYRLRGAGWKLRYLPHVTVTHHVDLADPSERPLQLSGSVSANILLRNRFGGVQLGEAGEALLSQAIRSERNPLRQKALVDAQAAIMREREHFQTGYNPEQPVPFPFTGFDYVMPRPGAEVRLPSGEQFKEYPQVTIVTRTHGPRVDILREAVTSVLNQTYPNIEHLIVEDRTDFASDLVASVAAAYGTNIRYLKSDGEGRSAAGNFGLANATGELLMFLDNDDLLFPDHVELLVRALDENPQHVGAYTLAWETQTQYDEQGCYRELMHSLSASHCIDFDRQRLERINFIPIQSMLFRRALFDQEGGFSTEIEHLEDWNLWWRYAHYGDFLLIHKLTSIYRTPANRETRARRQVELDDAYDRVRTLNKSDRKRILQIPDA